MINGRGTRVVLRHNPPQRELEAKLDADAQREAAQVRAQIATLVGGDPVLDIPVVRSSSTVLREAQAQLAKRLRDAEEAEEDVRAQYRSRFFAELEIAAKNAGADYARAARELEKSLLALQ